MNRCLPFFIIVLMGFAIRLPAQSPSRVLKGDLLITNVSIVDVERSRIVEHRNVLIQGDRILAIRKDAKDLEGARTLDASGKFLMPGLWDMHTHNWWQIHFSNEYIRLGVLGVRNMYTPMSLVGPLRDSINNGLLDGPHYYAAGRVIEGAKPDFPDWLVVDTREKIGPALDSLQSEGSDFVKVYNKIPRDVYFALMEAAKRRGMRVEGHLPMAVSALEASNAGQRSFEHLLGIPDLCTHDTLFQDKHGYNWFAALMKEDDYGQLSFDEKLAAQHFKVLRRNGTHVCPTLVVLFNYFHADSAFESSPLLARMPEEVAQYWSGALKGLRERDAAYKEMSLRKYETMKRVTRLLHRSRVPMLAGTDVCNPYCYPGYSLHDELALLNACGIPAGDVLKMATLNPVRFIGIQETHGTVEEGKVASLVLLGANPLEDIRNTNKIEAVVLKGKLIDKAQLEGM